MRHALLLILYMLRESRRGHTPSQNSDDGRSVEAVTEHVSEQFTRYVELYGLATDRRVFDHIDAGLQPGEMFVIAGCPGTGKASLMLSLVGDFCSHQQVPTLVFGTNEI